MDGTEVVRGGMDTYIQGIYFGQIWISVVVLE